MWKNVRVAVQSVRQGFRRMVFSNSYFSIEQGYLSPVLSSSLHLSTSSSLHLSTSSSLHLSTSTDQPPPQQGIEGEKRIQKCLKEKFPNATDIHVADISGGCGAMYEIVILSPQFKGLSMIKQHRMVNEALKEEIKDMHGIRIQTGVPES